VLVVILAVALVVVVALAAAGREIARLRGAITQLERRVVALELDSAPTLVVEPDPATPPTPRPPNALVN
jgi:hypothetical protein